MAPDHRQHTEPMTTCRTAPHEIAAVCDRACRFDPQAATVTPLATGPATIHATMTNLETHAAITRDLAIDVVMPGRLDLECTDFVAARTEHQACRERGVDAAHPVVHPVAYLSDAAFGAPGIAAALLRVNGRPLRAGGGISLVELFPEARAQLGDVVGVVPGDYRVVVSFGDMRSAFVVSARRGGA